MAKSRDDAYAVLKKQGIKPSRVEEAPGFFNKLFGKGKRWIAIAVLVVIATGLALALGLTKKEEIQSFLYEERAQLYGDPAVIDECFSTNWANVFDSQFDCRLALYAIPGRVVDADLEINAVMPENDKAAITLVKIEDNELAEVAQMKRMVNGMKRELAEYLKAGGTIESYLNRLNIRQKAEKGFFETAQRQVIKAKDHAVWREKNAELRAMGLPMIPPDVLED